MRRHAYRACWITALLFAPLFTMATLADEPQPPADAEPNKAADVTEVTPDPNQDDHRARDVMEQLLEQRRAAPTIDPARPPQVRPEPSRVGAPAAQADLDPAIVGIAPGGEQPKLLPEGTFIVSRRGRLSRSRDGAHVLFLFEADSPDAAEMPMVLLPCRKLEDMEDYVEKHGDQTVFKLSGQVHTYRGANYLLPTMMVIDFDRGNLKN